MHVQMYSSLQIHHRPAMHMRAHTHAGGGRKCGVIVDAKDMYLFVVYRLL